GERGRGNPDVVDTAVPRGGIDSAVTGGLTTQAGFIRLAYLKRPKSGKPDFGWSIFFANVRRRAGGENDGLLAFENRARRVFLERSGQTRRQGRAVDRRAQLHRSRKPQSDEEG